MHTLHLYQAMRPSIEQERDMPMPATKTVNNTLFPRVGADTPMASHGTAPPPDGIPVFHFKPVSTSKPKEQI